MSKRPRKIKTKATPGDSQTPAAEIGGWLHGKNTYLWIGHRGACAGTISGGKLYRLAKAIVKQYEEGQ